jgi:YbbR domain-containing protein
MKNLSTLAFVLFLTLTGFSQTGKDPKAVEVSKKEFLKIKNDLKKKRIAFYIDAGNMKEGNYGKSPKVTVTYVCKELSPIYKLTTGPRPGTNEWF